MMSEGELTVIRLDSVRDFVMKGYIPFAEIDRDITWPGSPDDHYSEDPEEDAALARIWNGISNQLGEEITGRPGRMENDAEHSFSLAVVGCAIGEVLGLDTGKIAELAIMHDFPELITGDASVWDKVRHAEKTVGEDQAIEIIDQMFSSFPWPKKTILEYTSMVSEEARFVYALDKFIALLILYEGGGKFWRDRGITFEQHVEMRERTLPKVARHPVILDLYEELLTLVEQDKDRLFATSAN